MRLLCLYFPRLGPAVARKAHGSLSQRPVVILTGAGDAAVVADSSVEAASNGVRTGMAAQVARQRCPNATFLAADLSSCLGTLEEAASLLRLRATPNVAVVSGSHILVDLRGLEARFADEAVAATRLAASVKAWTGVDVRAGVGTTAADARAAAESARRFPIIAARTGESETHLTPPNPGRAVAGSFAVAPHSDARTVRGQVLRLLGRLALLTDGREESFRRVRVEVERAVGAETAVISAPQPLHTAAEALALLAAHETEGFFEDARAVRVTFERLGPDMRVEPQRSAPGDARTVIQAPVRPIQQRLLRAG